MHHWQRVQNETYRRHAFTLALGRHNILVDISVVCGIAADCGGGCAVNEKQPTVSQLKRTIERLEAQLEAANELNLRIGSGNFRTVIENADARLVLRQIAEMAGGML